MPTNNPDGGMGVCNKHRNLRIAYVAQHTAFHLDKFAECTPLSYISVRFRNGWDEELQSRLSEHASQEEKDMIDAAAKRYGKYGLLF
jgi:elongation factor 3